jgi:hypothetical protein
MVELPWDAWDLRTHNTEMRHGEPVYQRIFPLSEGCSTKTPNTVPRNDLGSKSTHRITCSPPLAATTPSDGAREDHIHFTDMVADCTHPESTPLPITTTAVPLCPVVRPPPPAAAVPIASLTNPARGFTHATARLVHVVVCQACRACRAVADACGQSQQRLRARVALCSTPQRQDSSSNSGRYG